jgi:F-type H+-transporting ATPase subunit b
MSNTTTQASNFLIPDATFLAEIVAFVLILAFMWKYVVPPLQKNLEKRQEAIKQQLEDARQAKERLDAAEADYAAALAEARAEAARTREEARRIRQEIIDGARDEARTAAEEVTRLAEERLQAQHRQALNELRAEVGKLAADLASRIVGESLADEELQRRVIDRFLAELAVSEPVEQSEQVH